MRLGKSVEPCAAFNLVETAFACALVGIFFIGLFLINSQCLYYANCSRELLTASNVLQTRMEQLRNCHWSQVTDSTGSYIAGSNVLGTAASGATNLSTLTEVIKVDSYPYPTGTPITVTRSSNGTVTVNQTNSAVTNGDLAVVTVQSTWTTAPGARARSVALETVWAENTR